MIGDNLKVLIMQLFMFSLKTILEHIKNLPKLEQQVLQRCLGIANNNLEISKEQAKQIEREVLLQIYEKLPLAHRLFEEALQNQLEKISVTPRER